MGSQHDKFEKYHVTDFIEDESFVEAVKTPGSDADAFWKSLYEEYPSQRAHMDEARQLILHLKFSKAPLDPQTDAEIWRGIEKGTMPLPTIRRISRSRWVGYAASFALFFGLIGYLLFSLNFGDTRIATGPGEMRTVSLPDGSSVILNGNSEISFKKRWSKDRPREVSFTGDGNFDINRIGSPSENGSYGKFLVHAGRSVVEVLGTNFTVRNRQGNTKVALRSGKVAFSLKGNPATETKMVNDRIYMSPGDIVEYTEGQTLPIVKKENADSRLTWENGNLQFEGTTLNEILQYIEDIYSYKSVLDNSELGNRQISGEFSNKELDMLLQTIGSALGLDITQDKQNRVLVISSN